MSTRMKDDERALQIVIIDLVLIVGPMTLDKLIIKVEEMSS